MASSKLITVFDKEDSFSSVITALSLDVDEVWFVYHHLIDESYFTYASKVIFRHKKVVLHFMQILDDKKDIDDILKKDETMIVDVGGEKYLSLVLFDRVLDSKHPIVYYDSEENVIKSYREHMIFKEKIYPLSIEDIVNLKGGEITSHMHKAADLSDADTTSLIERVVHSSIDSYPRFINFVQKINTIITRKDTRDGKTFYLKEDEIERIVKDESYRKYEREGLLKVEGNRLILHSYKVAKLFSVSGAFLENYLYIKLKRSGYFDDVMMSCVIDFSGQSRKYPVVCEIDCLVIKDNHVLFTSCKSNKVAADDLNEIKVHNVIFGNTLSSPVMCTLEDLDLKSPSVYSKARELDVAVIDRSSFQKDRVADDFLSVAEKTYTYEKMPD